MYVCCEGVVYQNTHNPTPPYKLSHTHKHTHTHTHTRTQIHTHTYTVPMSGECSVRLQTSPTHTDIPCPYPSPQPRSLQIQAHHTCHELFYSLQETWHRTSSLLVVKTRRKRRRRRRRRRKRRRRELLDFDHPWKSLVSKIQNHAMKWIDEMYIQKLTHTLFRQAWVQV